jgi:hypothetical protein
MTRSLLVYLKRASLGIFLTKTKPMRILFISLILVHGLIHLLGFFKAFQIGTIEQLSKEISHNEGSFWLFTTLLFFLTLSLYLLHQPAWTIIALAAIILSQILILGAWQDAKFGSIANVIILIAAILSLSSWRFEQQFRQDVRDSWQASSTASSDTIQEKDLLHLPVLVKEYLHLANVVGKPKTQHMQLHFKGKMRSKTQDWFDFQSEQFNSFNKPNRLFFMKAKIKGLPALGYHSYKDGVARMQVKLWGLIPVAKLDGPKMWQAETVTFFNDLCLFAPAALIDPKIQWQAIDELSVQATFTNQGTTISATLLFNSEGQLVNFISDDRFVAPEMQALRFSTPVKDFKSIHSYQVPTYGEAIWHYPEGPFVYGVFNLAELEYNSKTVPFN